MITVAGRQSLLLGVCATCGLLGAVTAAYGQAPAPPVVTLNAPGMDGPLSFPTNPYAIDAGPLGKWYVDAALTGLGYAESNALPGDRSVAFDLSDGQIFINKVDGIWQFYIQAGAYSIPVIGAPYAPNDAGHALNNYFGPVPQAFLKLAPTSSFSLMAGKLPTLIGPESTFSFENFNIQRGLLWNEEPAVSRGVQAAYVAGPLSFNVSLNDGYYSNHYNWVSGSAAWAPDAANTLTFAAGGNFRHTSTTQFATPQAQNNSSIYNIIYTCSSAPWTVTPYLQFQNVPRDPRVGITKGAQAYAGALLVSYAIDGHWSIGARAEYIDTNGGANLLYGAGSKAFTLTATPTYQYKRFFVRAEAAAVIASSIAPNAGFGAAFGLPGNATNQIRGLLEGGVLF
jgi:hypothetical protein